MSSRTPDKKESFKQKLDSRRKRRAARIRAIERFIKRESFGGILLLVAAVAAMIIANSPWSEQYFNLLHMDAGVKLGRFSLEMSLEHWINHGLIALFFLLIGLEVKREVLAGELSSPSRLAFPAVAAVGGMVVPALLYFLVNMSDGGVPRGFGIPMGTDTAFAIGILALLGKRVPLSLKVFLVSTAVIDDVGVVIIIAAAYTSSIDWAALGWAGLVIAGLIALNIGGVKKLVPYLLLGLILWYFVLQSGLHATLAGIILALTIPLRQKISCSEFIDTCKTGLEVFGSAEGRRTNVLLTYEQQDTLDKMGKAYEQVQNPLLRLEHSLHPISAYFVMPVFALANAGIPFGGGIDIWQPVALGIMLGLVIGKPLGIVGLTFVLTKLKLLRKPSSCQWQHIIGAGLLGGMGFTMSMFIAVMSLDAEVINAAKLAIVLSSLVAGLVGALFIMSQPVGECETIDVDLPH